MRSSVVIAACMALAIGFDARADVIEPTQGSLFSPHSGEITSLGSLSLSSGQSITFNTDTGEVSGAFSAMSNDTGNSLSGNVTGIRLFKFNSIDIASGATINVTGSSSLAIISGGDFNLNSPIILSDPVATPGINGAGGVGAASSGNGVAGGFNGGEGGYTPTNILTTSGEGPGGGGVQNNNPDAGGGGGGYGGAGTTGIRENGSIGGAAGAVVPDDQLSDLFGGSGGGGGMRDSGNANAASGGGAGGAAVELVAAGTLNINALLDADGGNGGTGQSRADGGGGSGGAILLAADNLVFGSSALLSVQGGNGGSDGGGGGGGGRIAAYYNSTSGFGEDLSVEGMFQGDMFGFALMGGGSNGQNNAMGGAGVFYYAGLDSFPFAAPLTPEPSTFVLSSILFVMTGVTMLRRRRREVA